MELVQSRVKKIPRRKRKARQPILVIKSEILTESSSDSTDIEDDLEDDSL